MALHLPGPQNILVAYDDRTYQMVHSRLTLPAYTTSRRVPRSGGRSSLLLATLWAKKPISVANPGNPTVARDHRCGLLFSSVRNFAAALEPINVEAQIAPFSRANIISSHSPFRRWRVHERRWFTRVEACCVIEAQRAPMEDAPAKIHAGNSFGLSTPASVNVIPIDSI